MSEEVNSIYSAPESDLGSDGASDKGIHHFERFSAWGVFGLCIVTLGIYPIYWLYTRSIALNGFSAKEVSEGLLKLFLIVTVGSIACSIVAGFVETSAFDTLDGLVGLAQFVFYMIVLFTFRSRLSDATGIHSNGILVFFFSAIYLQYKINQEIDRTPTE